MRNEGNTPAGMFDAELATVPGDVTEVPANSAATVVPLS